MLGSPSQSYFAAITSPNARRSSASVTIRAAPMRTFPSRRTSTEGFARRFLRQSECSVPETKISVSPTTPNHSSVFRGSPLLRPTVTMSQHSTSAYDASQDTSEISLGGTRRTRRAKRRLLRQALRWLAGLLSLDATRCPCPLRFRAKLRVLLQPMSCRGWPCTW